VFGLVLAVSGLRTPYVAIARPDRSLTFRAVTGSVTTSISRISRITLSTGARGGESWFFYFDGTRAKLADLGGRALARYVIDNNPAVEYPPVRQLRR
jgi:hypothetical protein